MGNKNPLAVIPDEFPKGYVAIDTSIALDPITTDNKNAFEEHGCVIQFPMESRIDMELPPTIDEVYSHGISHGSTLVYNSYPTLTEAMNAFDVASRPDQVWVTFDESTSK